MAGFFLPTNMLKLLRSLMPGKPSGSPVASQSQNVAEPTDAVHAAGVADFSVSAHLEKEGGFPIVNWEAAHCWVDSIPDAAARGAAWGRLERAWLEHLQSALGSAYAVHESETALLLSTLQPNVAKSTLDFMAKTLQRVVRVLDGIANAPDWGKDILIVFDEDTTYYRYVSQYYPSAAGEFAGSGGMYINAGCGHFATVKSELRVIEPTIAHEMTHGCLSHLPIPTWLNEGLAVNTEHRLCPSGPSMFSPQQMHEKHRAFWGEAEIQEFWSGKSFLRNDDANLLSYDLARILVAQLSADWSSFKSFALSASASDAGAAAAVEHLDLELGAAVSALLERNPTNAWSPTPDSWQEAPEPGG